MNHEDYIDAEVEMPAAVGEHIRRAVLAALEGDYQILPGHGPQSMLSVERITNPYLGTSYDDIF